MDQAERVELLGEAPPRLGRLMGLVGGRGYAATWLLARVSRDVEKPAQSGDAGALVLKARAEVVRADDRAPRVAAPLVRIDRRVETRTERRLCVVRDDGAVFADGVGHPLRDLGVEIALAEPPRDERLWRLGAVQRYARGERPEPRGVLERLAACYDAFIDFGRSLGDQRTMCELCACLSLATWLSDAFTLVPYVWITGERGSGKTQLGTVWALTSYLGEAVLASGTYPALRDLAEVGAALYFDDAESFAGAKRGGGAKRELLLAGNRRGAQAAVKTVGPGGWRTRWANAYTPRAFSSIGRPDATLGSRALVVPLTRTLDGTRGQRDPGDATSWPCDRLALQDDLWALGLWWQAEAARAWRQTEASEELVGRAYEPWRPVLAVARLLEEHGVEGIEERLRGLMRGYQGERAELESDDETVEVVRGLVHAVELLIGRIPSAADPARREREVEIPNDVLAEAVILATPDGALSARSARARPIRVGQVMGRLRFRSTRTATFKRTRSWVLTVGGVLEVARAYGVPTRVGESATSKSMSSMSSVSKSQAGGSTRTRVRPRG